MTNFNNYDLLEIIEEFADYNSLICCGSDLSKKFDDRRWKNDD